MAPASNSEILGRMGDFSRGYGRGCQTWAISKSLVGSRARRGGSEWDVRSLMKRSLREG